MKKAAGAYNLIIFFVIIGCLLVYPISKLVTVEPKINEGSINSILNIIEEDKQIIIVKSDKIEYDSSEYITYESIDCICDVEYLSYKTNFDYCNEYIVKNVEKLDHDVVIEYRSYNRVLETGSYVLYVEKK